MANHIWLPRFYPQGRFFRLFLSHTNARKAEVGLLSSALSSHGIAGFVAHDAIHPTQEWQDVIVNALREAEALAAYLTADFPDSLWTDQEVGAAVGRGLLVLPLKVDIDPYGFIARYQAMNAAGADPQRLAESIASSLLQHPLTKAAMAEAVVDRFVRAYSYDDARKGLRRLQALPRDAWTQDVADSVARALVENNQLADAVIGSTTVPSAALDLLNELGFSVSSAEGRK